MKAFHFHVGKYAVTVKRAAGGFASGWILDNREVGTPVTVSGPQGTFNYEPLRDAAHVVGIAGGSLTISPGPAAA